MTSEPLRVLIVEDRPSDAELMVARLEEEGFVPDWIRVEDEDTFVAELDTAPDLILADWRLPAFSGLKALRAVRGRGLDIPFVIVSGSIGEEAAVDALHEGADDYVLKDRMARLGPAVRRVLQAKSQSDERRRIEARYRAISESATDGIVTADETGVIVLWNRAAEQIFGYSAAEAVGQSLTVLMPERYREAHIHGWSGVLAGGEPHLIGGVAAFHGLRKDTIEFPIEISLSTWEVAGGRFFTAILRDVTEERTRSAERARLSAAIEHASDLVIVTDLAGSIEYVNPAFELVSGYRRDEVIGSNPRIFQSGGQSVGFYRSMWRRLMRGDSWTGRLSNRGKDGALYEVEATVSPIRAVHSGEVTGYIGVQRDITALDQARSSLADEIRERAAVSAALARLQRGATVEATAAVICDELVSIPGIDLAAILQFTDPRRAVPLAVSGPVGSPVTPGEPLPASRSEYLHERAMKGPWAEAWQARPEDGLYGQALTDLGIQAAGYAPIRDAKGLLGLIAIATHDEAYATHIINHLPIINEFAAATSALLGGQFERTQRDLLARGRIERVLAERAFSPVFQPIVDLASGETVGYEALTRFADGTRPDVMFADAHSVGLGCQLEIACLAAALTASEVFAEAFWLSLNASPEVILHPTELPALLAGRSRQIVIEVTEHVAIDDYPGVRRAVAALGPNVSLAVDDAGSGLASLRHVVELAPQFLKLDISLVRHVDRELTRQAMIAGLRHFADRTGCLTIAEGIEELAELEMLRELGVPFGQGYLLGRPGPPPVAGRSSD